MRLEKSLERENGALAGVFILGAVAAQEKAEFVEIHECSTVPLPYLSRTLKLLSRASRDSRGPFTFHYASELVFPKENENQNIAAHVCPFFDHSTWPLRPIK
jgi:hypothetical protein